MQILLKAVNYSGSGPWLDESGNGKDATLLEGSYSKNTGGNGIILNGSTSWTFPNLALGNSWTASVWYKNTGSTTPNAACILTQLYGGASNSSSVLIGYLYNNSGFNTSISGGFVSNATSYNGSLITLTNAIWTNIQVTWNGISMRTYINGTAIADTTPGGVSIDSTSSYLIGGSYVPYNNFMTGEIGEVRIYNYPLTQAQVTADYTSSLPTFQNLMILLKAVNYGGSVSLDPTTIPGCQLWLDGADQTTMTFDNTTITQWDDKSGLDNHTTAVTGTPTYTTGKGVTFNGSSFYNLPDETIPYGDSSYSIYAVFTYTQTNSGLLSGGPAANSESLGIIVGSTINNYWYNNDISVTNTVSANTQLLYNTSYQSGGQRSIFIDGVNLANDTPGVRNQPSTGNTIGKVNLDLFMNGTISEVLIYNTKHTTQQRQSIENYLMAKWNISKWADESGNGFSAILESGTAAKNTLGNGLVLNGSTSWAFPSVAVGNSWTVNVWYKNTGATIGGIAPILAQINTFGTGKHNIILYGDINNSFGFYNNAWNTGTTITVPDNVWVNMQGTWDGTNLSTYINGTLIGITQPGGISVDSTSIYRIGKRWDAEYYRVGEIGEVRIYNYPLTQAQVTNDYNSSYSIFNTLLVLFKGINYTTGSWIDETGNGFDATLENGTATRNAAQNGLVLNGSTNWTFPNIAVGPKWTASVWYKNTGAPIGDNACILIQVFTGTPINIGIGYLTSGLTGGYFNNNWYVGNEITLTNGAWTNIQVTWDGTNMSTYINGNLLGTMTPGGTSADSGNAYRIGRWDNEDYMIGEIGEVRIYNYPLTQAQVNADFFSSYYTFYANTVPYPPLIHKRPKALNNRIVLNWKPPTLYGGTPITNYTLTSGQQDVNSPYTISSIASSFNFTGLTNGTQYTYSLAAVNNLGTGSNATFRTVRPGPRSSQLVSSPTAVINGSNVTINWNAFSGQNTNNIQWTVAKTQLLSGNGSLPKFNVQFGQTSMTAATGLDLVNNRYKFSLHYVNDPGYSVPTFTNAVGTGTYTFIRPTTLPLYNTGLLRSVTSSADANRIITCISGNKFWASTDKGISWTQNTTIENNGWNGIVCSSNGTRFLAIDGSNGFVWFSANSGATWTAQSSLGEKNWNTIAISSNGNYAAAGVKNGYIYTGTYNGSVWSWTEQTDSGTRYWASLVISDDGTTLYAGENNNAQYQNAAIWKSTDSGLTWAKVDNGQNTNSTPCAFSANGTKMYASKTSSLGGGIYFSSDLGKTWIYRDNSSVIGVVLSLSCSSDGTFLVATDGGSVYTSSNSGLDWASVFTPSGYSNVAAACTTTGATIYAIGQDANGIYIWKSTNSGSTWSSSTYVSVTLVGDSRTGNFVCSKDGAFLYFAIGYGNVWGSYDSGATWTEFTTDPPGAPEGRYLSCTDNGETIYVTGANGSFKGLFDSGTSTWTWSSITLNGSTATFLTVSGNGSVLTAITDQFYKSMNGGSTWTGYPVTSNTGGYNPTLSYDGSIILIAPNRAPFVTVNGGTTWYTDPDPGAWSCIRMSADTTKVITTNVFGTYYSYIYLSTDSGETWLPFTAAGSRYWTSITVSADFTKMAATAKNDYIYCSTDSGATWTQVTTTGTQVWASITGNSTGQYLTAVVDGGTIWVSHDYGALWYSYVETPSQICRATAISRNASTLLTVSPVPYISNNGGLYWRPLNIFNQTDPNNFLTASAFVSIDGSFIAIAINWTGNLNGGSPYIMTSANYGYSWTQQTTSGQRPWTGITGSSNGSKLAAVADSDYIYVSADSGASWSSVATQQGWRGIASSDNGIFLVACTTNSGSIWTSSNSGTDWTDQTNAGSGNWSSVACNTTGATIFATQNTGYIYKSSDSGVTWAQVTTDTTRTWTNISCSPDGVYIVATEGGAYIWISPDGGLTWNYQAGSASTNLNSASVALNGDGVRIIAANNNSSYIMLGDI